MNPTIYYKKDNIKNINGWENCVFYNPNKQTDIINYRVALLLIIMDRERDKVSYEQIFRDHEKES